VNPSTPAEWVTRHAPLLARGEALDVACGRGRHAFWLAEQGCVVTAVDRDARAVDEVAAEARRRRLPITAVVADLEGERAVLAPGAFEMIVVVHYLHRPLFPQLIEALRPKGVLIYETFTEAQAARGRPTSPAFLLRPGELRTLVSPLEIVAWREGAFDGRDVAAVVARKAG
jgi:SAM-dependent methyltransferase